MTPELASIIFMLLMAAVIAISLKVVGVPLATALLIIPAATARRFATGPEQMAVLVGLIGAAGVFSGLLSSLEWDTPAGPRIVVAALLLFVLSQMPGPLLSTVKSRRTRSGDSEATNLKRPGS